MTIEKSITVGEWIDALESGKYKRGSGYLNRDGKMCCLGVACELVGLPAEVSWMTDGVIQYRFEASEEGDWVEGLWPLSVARENEIELYPLYSSNDDMPADDESYAEPLKVLKEKYPRDKVITFRIPG